MARDKNNLKFFFPNAINFTIRRFPEEITADPTIKLHTGVVLQLTSRTCTVISNITCVKCIKYPTRLAHIRAFLLLLILISLSEEAGQRTQQPNHQTIHQQSQQPSNQLTQQPTHPEADRHEGWQSRKNASNQGPTKRVSCSSLRQTKRLLRCSSPG